MQTKISSVKPIQAPFQGVVKIALTAAAVTCFVTNAGASDWNGMSPVRGGNNNWSTGANWVGGMAPQNGTDLEIVFAGNTRRQPQQDIAKPYELNRLTFKAGAGAFTLGGDGIRFIISGGLQPQLLQESANQQTIAVPIDLSAAGGPLTLTIGGQGAGRLNLTAEVTGMGNLTKEGPYDLRLGSLLGVGGGNANTYGGVTTVNQGVLQLNKQAGVMAVPGDLVIGNGTGTDTVRLLQRDQIANTSKVTVNEGGILDLTQIPLGLPVNPANARETIGSLSGKGTVKLGVATLTTGAAVDSVFEGSITGPHQLLEATTFGAGNLVKVGDTKFTLKGASPYQGKTTVTGGTLEVAKGATIGAPGAKADLVTVNGGAALNGAGKIFTRKDAVGVKIEPNGTIKPKNNSPGILTLNGGDVILDPGSLFDVELDGPTPGDDFGFHSQLDITGNVSLDGSILKATLSYLPSQSDRLFIIENELSADTTSGMFRQGTEIFIRSSEDFNRYRFEISYSGDADTHSISGGNDVVLHNATLSVPDQASTIILLGLALCGLSASTFLLSAAENKSPPNNIALLQARVGCGA